MYCDFYNLVEKPFNVTPDPKFLYLNARYREALASLHYGITERKGFVTLIGEAGTGKTTLLNKLLDQLDPKTKTILIFNTNVSFEDILEYIFTEFDLPVHSGKKLYLLQRLNAFLLEELRGGGNVALLIDEAQDLEFSVLEDLRLLSNLETAKEKILQIILTGQPELGQKLSSPGLRQLRQRIAVNCRLLPLSREEMSEYIQYRLQAAGCTDLKVFSREAEDRVWELSRGIPRLVNVVCDNALVIGYALGKKRIGADVVNEAATDMIAALPDAVPIEVGEPAADAVAPTGELEEAAAPLPPGRARGTWAIFAVVGVALLVGLISMGRSMLREQSEAVNAALPPSPRAVMRPGSDSSDLPPVAVGLGSDPSESRLKRPQMNGRPAPAAEEPPRRPEQAAPDAPLLAPAAPPPAAQPLARNGAEPAPAAAEPGVAEAGLPAAEMPAAAPAVGDAIDAPAAAAPAGAAENTPVPPAAQEPRPAAGAIDVDPPAKAEPPSNAADAPAATAQLAAVEPERAEWPSAKPEAAAIEKGLTYHLVGQRFDEVPVHDGDSIGQIAIQKYGQASYTVLDLLKLANPDVADIDRISVGQQISLPQLSRGFSVLADDRGQYGVLVQSSVSASRAKALAQALRTKGYGARVELARIGAEKSVYRVLIGSLPSESVAAGVGQEIERAFRDDERLARLARY